MINISHCNFSQNNSGVVIDGSDITGKITGSIINTEINGNINDGVSIYNGTSSSISILIDSDTIVGNGHAGLHTFGNLAGMLVKNSSIIDNQGSGIFPNYGGVIYSYGNNAVNGNNMLDGNFTSTLGLR